MTEPTLAEKIEDLLDRWAHVEKGSMGNTYVLSNEIARLVRAHIEGCL